MHIPQTFYSYSQREMVRKSSTACRGLQARRSYLVAVFRLLGGVTLAAKTVHGIPRKPVGLKHGTAGASLATNDDMEHHGSFQEGGNDVSNGPQVPFCRAYANVANIWLPIQDEDTRRTDRVKRVIIFGGKG